MTSTTTIDSQRATTSHRRDRIFLSAVDTYENVDLNRGSFNDTSDRVRVSAAQVLQRRPAVILIFGQSNGANSGDAPYVPRNRVFAIDIAKYLGRRIVRRFALVLLVMTFTVFADSSILQRLPVTCRSPGPAGGMGF